MAGFSTRIELNSVIVGVNSTADEDTPVVLATAMPPFYSAAPTLALPSGPFETGHRTLEQGLRNWAGMPLGYVEQLYTFADSDRTTGNERFVSIGYLALMRTAVVPQSAKWSSWYKHFPWEDHRHGLPPLITGAIVPALTTWKNSARDTETKQLRAERIAIAFPRDVKAWNEELVLQRYELLWEAGLTEERQKPKNKDPSREAQFGLAMAHDHRRILATAIARLRAKIKYRPVVFELMPDTFTLLQLQNTVAALAGLRLHKQNFRRLVESQGLVEETGAMARGTSGRPAKLFAFRREVLRERGVAGTKLPRSS